ncbi:MAG: type IV toxin-antitoxin system AbiEi family antitoxin domain-containing protein [Actinomycetota bacterium]|nr:type IV toxin-antitoxin system AbiEi family antitoxin domain-containing protein [Actinomycetota bacterium]
MDTDNEALRVAASQGGVIRLDQALGYGISNSAISRRVHSGQWQRIARSVYRLIDMEDPRDRVRAAIAGLPQAVASHETAAELHRVARLPAGRAVVTVHAKTTHTFPGVTVHRTRDLGKDHTTAIDGLPVTTLPRTIIDLSAKLHPGHLAAIVDDLVASKRLDVDKLSDLAASIARRGKPGSTTLRSLISEREGSGIAIASRLERRGLAVLLDAGLPRPTIEHPAPWDETRRLDAAYPDAKIGIEWDSTRWHTLVTAFQRDRVRDRLALLEGWRVFRFTWDDVTERPYDVVATIRTALNSPLSAK